MVGAGTTTITKVGPTATSGQVLQSQGSSSDPAFSTATYPSTTTVNDLLYSSATNVVGQITTANDGVLITSNTGVPSWLANSGTPGFILTANAGAPPSWQASGAGNVTITGDTGSITGASLTVFANNATENCGGSVKFSNSGTTSTLNVTDSNSNTLIGNSCGNTTLSGTVNCGLGESTLFQLTTGSQNTGIGIQTGNSITTGTGNTTLGHIALNNLGTGSNNTCLGKPASGGCGGNYTGAESSNICLNNNGTTGESNTIRIGNGTDQTKCFVAGIFGVTVSVGTGTAVFVDNTGQMGTVVSSARYKENILPLNEISDKIYQLSPKTFNYKADKSKISQFGLIAEEVEAVFPELVIYNAEGSPETVKYHDLPI